MRIFGAGPLSSVSHSVGTCEQFAVGVAAGDVGDHGRRQGGGLVDLSPALGDGAVVGELAQDALQLDAVGILQPELAGDFPRADLARIRTDEGDDGVPAWKTIVVFSLHLSPGLARALLRRRLGCGGGLRRRCLGSGRDRRACLADGFRFRFHRGFLRRRLLGRLWRVGIGSFMQPSWRGLLRLRPSWRRASACRRPWRRARRSARWPRPALSSPASCRSGWWR